MNGPLTNDTQAFTVTIREQKLLVELRKVPYGRVEITMVGGQPERIEKVRESIKL